MLVFRIKNSGLCTLRWRSLEASVAGWGRNPLGSHTLIPDFLRVTHFGAKLELVVWSSNECLSKKPSEICFCCFLILWQNFVFDFQAPFKIAHKFYWSWITCNEIVIFPGDTVLFFSSGKKFFNYFARSKIGITRSTWILKDTMLTSSKKIQFLYFHF